MKGQAKEPGVLYLVGTPVGNLEDLTFRALRTLKEVAWIAAEDTRQTRKLLESQGISAELTSFHEHSPEAKAEALLTRLREGESGAYVSDAGTPGICDPGAVLVRVAAAAGITVTPVPGASALTALLSVAGFGDASFSFLGFFPREKPERRAWAIRAHAEGGLRVFFESPHRIGGTLSFLAAEFPAAPLVVGRELTKKFETITRGAAAEVAARLGPEEPRGEYVLALHAGAAREEEGAPALSDEVLEALLAELAGLGAQQKILVRVGLSHGRAKNAAYALALKALNK